MRLYLLQFALSDSGSPVPGYLIRTDSGENILVDSGFPAGAIGTNPFADFVIKPEDHVTRQLALVGLAPSDINYLVSTHFDFDHAGAHDLFTAAECIVQRRHWEAAHDGSTTRFDRYRAHWDSSALNYRQVDGDTTLVPGVELIDTSGHVAGHQSVLLRLPQTGPVLLAIDAAPSQSCFDPATYAPSPYDMDKSAAKASIQKMKDVMAREGVALTICGHDAKQWASLRKAPQFYD